MCFDLGTVAGRYVATFVTPIHQSENGFIVWSFNGEQIYRFLSNMLARLQTTQLQEW